MDGRYEVYREYGQLWMQYYYKDGKPDGPWEWFNENGSVNKEYSANYINGVKVSD